MNRWIVVAAACAFSLWSFASQAVTLEPLPGSTPQTTCYSCVFPNPIGVIARDASGAPLAGVAVTFTQSDNVGMVRFDDFCCVAYDQVTVTTGADGVAVGTVITLGVPGGTGAVTASADGAADVAFALSSTTQRATTVAVVSGDDQYAQTGTLFAAPWKVRLLDAAGHPVPNTMVSFYAGGYDGTMSSASFNGNDWAFAVADANGIATSPPARAGAIVGDSGSVDITVKVAPDGAFPDVSIQFHVVPYAIKTSRATLVSAPPNSLMTGTFAATPYVVRLLNASGQPVAGMPVTFSNDCGSAFNGATEQIVFSDAHGLARSALLEASVPAMCNIRIDAAGVVAAIKTTMHVFDPNLVVVTPRTPWVVAKTRHTYSVVVDFTESGMPIQPASLEAVNVLRAPHAPLAGIASPPAISIVNGSATLDLHANNVAGLYDLEIVFWGPSRTRVHVLQTP
jgi:hypothetical protein